MTAAAAPLGATDADRLMIEALVRRAGTSFYRGMRILPPERRLAMYAIYAFCRLVDDIADEESPIDDRLPRLAAWRARIAALYDGGVPPAGATAPEAPEIATCRVLAAAIARFSLRQADFVAVIDGMQMDAEHPIIAPDLDALDLYCDRAAAAVGRLSVRAFGDASADADAVANALGRALQLTNVLRDIAEDAGRGRLYLPREYLDVAGVPRHPLAALQAPGLGLVCARVAAMAEGYFDQAAAAMRLCDRRAMRPARLMAATYHALLREMHRRGWRNPTQRVSVPTWRKLALVLRHGLW